MVSGKKISIEIARLDRWRGNGGEVAIRGGLTRREAGLDHANPVIAPADTARAGIAEGARVEIWGSPLGRRAPLLYLARPWVHGCMTR